MTVLTLASKEQSSVDAVTDVKRRAGRMGFDVQTVERVALHIEEQRPGEPGLRTWEVTLRVGKAQ